MWVIQDEFYLVMLSHDQLFVDSKLHMVWAQEEGLPRQVSCQAQCNVRPTGPRHLRRSCTITGISAQDTRFAWYQTFAFLAFI